MSNVTETCGPQLPPATAHMLMAESEMFSPEGPDSYMQVPGFEGLEIRPLTHLEKYTNGRWGGVILRRLPGTQFAGSPWHMHELDAQYSYVVRGWGMVELEGLAPVRVEAGSSLVQPSLNRHRLGALSDDMIAIELSSPAKFTTTLWVWSDEAQAYRTVVLDSLDEPGTADQL